MTLFKHHTTSIIRSLLTAVAALALLTPVTAVAATPAKTAIPKPDQSTVIVKFKASASVSVQGRGFAATSGNSDAKLNAIIANNVKSQEPLISESKATIQQRRSQFSAQLNQGEGDLENYHILKLAPGKKADDVAKQLKALDSVETAYAKPVAVPAPLAPNYVPQQTHLKTAPTGNNVYALIGASGKAYPGSTGSLVRVVDLEYSWNTQHEDLSRLRRAGAVWTNGTPVDPFGDKEHGTAVAGLVAADRNSGGINGIVPSTALHTMNVNNKERGWDLSKSIYLAANKMIAGDVMLLEQQTTAPDGLGYAPVELIPDVYDAIKYATGKGITVIEAAGNGRADYWEGYNLNDPMFGNAFTTKPSSGAIMVGAGSSGCDYITPVRGRLAFSNYGSRVDVQAYGDCVVTTGYGDLYNPSANAKYTSTFGGTSSASAIIAGLAGQLSSTYEYVNKKPLTPATLKLYLKSGALAQNKSEDPRNIGPMPNMAVALRRVDTVKPSAPTTLTGKVSGTNKISLTWKPSTDNLGVVQYKIYRNGVFIKQVSGTSYTNTSLKPKTSYTYKVQAVDASFNASTFSNSVTVVNK